MRNPIGGETAELFQSLRSEQSRMTVATWLSVQDPTNRLYRDYLCGHADEIARQIMLTRDRDGLMRLIQTGMMTAELTDRCIVQSAEQEATELTAILLNYKNDTFGMTETAFRL